MTITMDNKFESGQEVTVIAGTFKGFTGKVEEVNFATLGRSCYIIVNEKGEDIYVPETMIEEVNNLEIGTTVYRKNNYNGSRYMVSGQEENGVVPVLQLNRNNGKPRANAKPVFFKLEQLEVL